MTLLQARLLKNNIQRPTVVVGIHWQLLLPILHFLPLLGSVKNNTLLHGLDRLRGYKILSITLRTVKGKSAGTRRFGSWAIQPRSCHKIYKLLSQL